MRDFLRQFFLYSRSERRAVIALAVLIGLAVIAPGVYRFYISHTLPAAIDPVLQQQISRWQKPSTATSGTTDAAIPSAQASSDHIASILFYFDPNTIGISEWQKLGLSQNKQRE